MRLFSVLLLAWDRVFEIKDALGTTKNKPEDLQELFRELSNDVQNIHEELAEYINTPGWNRPAFYDDDDDDDVDYTIAITPVLSNEEPVNSLSMGDEHLNTILETESDELIKSSVEDLVPIPSEFEGETGCDVPSCFTTFSNILFDDEYEFDSETIDSLSMGDEHLDIIPATKSDEVIKSSVENLVPIPSEFKGIPDTMCDVHLDNNHTPLEAKDHVEIVMNSNDDISSSDDDSLHEENIEYVEASPHDSELVSLEAAEIVIPEVEKIEDDNLREKLLNVYLLIANIEALKDNPIQSSEPLTKSSSTSLNSLLEETNTFHNSLPELENFYFDLGEISSGSTTTHSDISLSEYDSFIFDFAHEEFVDELAHIISPPEYDCFYFRDLPDPGELMYVLNSGIRENLLSTTRVNLPIEDDHSPLLAYVVWIFVAVSLTVLVKLASFT
nr:hypothetical protein [Tanacetum cinerariifolium]